MPSTLRNARSGNSSTLPNGSAPQPILKKLDSLGDEGAHNLRRLMHKSIDVDGASSDQAAIKAFGGLDHALQDKIKYVE
jgi:hypothetical protein